MKIYKPINKGDRGALPLPLHLLLWKVEKTTLTQIIMKG